MWYFFFHWISYNHIKLLYILNLSKLSCSIHNITKHYKQYLQEIKLQQNYIIITKWWTWPVQIVDEEIVEIKDHLLDRHKRPFYCTYMKLQKELHTPSCYGGSNRNYIPAIYGDVTLVGPPLWSCWLGFESEKRFWLSGFLRMQKQRDIEIDIKRSKVIIKYNIVRTSISSIALTIIINFKLSLNFLCFIAN